MSRLLMTLCPGLLLLPAACKHHAPRETAPRPVATTATPGPTSHVKPIEWYEGDKAPRLGDKYLDGRLVVDDVHRQVADGFLTVHVRLKNTGADPVLFESRCGFIDRRGKPVADALIAWRPAFAEGYDVVDIRQTCPLKAALDWTFEVRPPTGDTASESQKENATKPGEQPQVEPPAPGPSPR